MRFAIYVLRDEETFDRIDEAPAQLRQGTLAVRAYDKDGMMDGCKLINGDSVEDAIAALLADPRAAYLHIHYAARGCYAACVERA